MRVRVLDLFSGIGAFSLGLERAGMRTVAFCESDDYCRHVLNRHWPDVPVFGDVRELTAEALAHTNRNGCGITSRSGRARLPLGQAGKTIHGEVEEWQPVSGKAWGRGIDLICGGFPCQDISVAGKGAGIEGPRSGLWSEFARIIGEVRPRYVIVENVSALLGRGLGRVLGDLAALGYDAEWHCIPASAVGAPHRRDRVWIVAYRDEQRLEGWIGRELQECADERLAWESGSFPDAESNRRARQGEWSEAGHTDWLDKLRQHKAAHWFVESSVGRVADGIANRLDRLRALGNSLIPQIAEIIGRSIMTVESRK